MPKPFSVRRLEPARELIAVTYGLPSRTASRYLRVFADTLFRLRGRRLPVSGKGAMTMFSEDDWQLFETVYARMSVPSPGAIVETLTAFVQEVSLRAGEGSGVVDALLALRGDVQLLGQRVVGDLAASTLGQPTLADLLSGLPQGLAADRDAAHAEVLRRLSAQDAQIEQMMEKLGRLEDGITMLVQWAVSQGSSVGS